MEELYTYTIDLNIFNWIRIFLHKQEWTIAVDKKVAEILQNDICELSIYFSNILQNNDNYNIINKEDYYSIIKNENFNDSNIEEVTDRFVDNLSFEITTKIKNINSKIIMFS